MPTRVNPDDPSATGAARLQSMVGGREPGSPSMAGKPDVQAGRTSFPAPPAPATAPPGRPATPAPAPGGGRGAMAQSPQPGTVPASGAPAPAATAAPSAATPPTQPGSSQPAPGAGSSKTADTAAPAPPPLPSADAGGMATQTFTSPTLPKAADVPPGAQVQTPLGTVTSSPAGGSRLALDAAGQQKYKESVAALRGKFTVPRVMKGMTGLPQMELKLGASNFDPFSGRFHGRE